MLEDIEKDYVEHMRKEYADRKLGDGRIGGRKIETVTKDKEKENGKGKQNKGN